MSCGIVHTHPYWPKFVPIHLLAEGFVVGFRCITLLPPLLPDRIAQFPLLVLLLQFLLILLHFPLLQVVGFARLLSPVFLPIGYCFPRNFPAFLCFLPI